MVAISVGLGPESECCGNAQKQLCSKLQTRSLVREGDIHKETSSVSIQKIERKKLVAGPRWVPDTKTDWPTDCQS
jgi:hypothetical protein